MTICGPQTVDPERKRAVSWLTCAVRNSALPVDRGGSTAVKSDTVGTYRKPSMQVPADGPHLQKTLEKGISASRPP